MKKYIALVQPFYLWGVSSTCGAAETIPASLLWLPYPYWTATSPELITLQVMTYGTGGWHLWCTEQIFLARRIILVIKLHNREHSGEENQNVETCCHWHLYDWALHLPENWAERKYTDWWRSQLRNKKHTLALVSTDI